MGCVKGRVNPSTVTKLRLFADSGGYCSNPDCLTEIFVEFEDASIHIGEMAHVISAGDKGPRSDTSMTPEERGIYGNLILLCPNCHTIIDKAEDQYPVSLLQEWKSGRKEIIANAFGIMEFDTRPEARSTVEQLFEENHFIFEQYGPLTDARFNPESELPHQWRRKIRQKIIPNNRKILALCEANRKHLAPDEKKLLLAFAQHVDDFEAKHLGGAEQHGARFPEGMGEIFVGEKNG